MDSAVRTAAHSAAEAAGGSPARPRTETRTFLFSDIEGSSRLERELGTEAYAELRSRHRALLRAAFTAEGGAEQGTEGDSFFVVFPSALAAVRAAVAGQRALASEPWPAGGTIRVRVGIHTGDALVVDGDYVGIDINRAARIAAAGHGGQIVVSDVSRALIDDQAGRDALGGDVALRDLGVHRLKDFDPLRLFDVVATGLESDFPALRSAGSAFVGLPAQPTTLVGRGREVAAVLSLLRRARLVTLTGPGGTGKTRLAISSAQAALGDFPAGVAWVGLSPIVDPDLVGPTVAQAVGVVDDGTRPIEEAIVERLGAFRVLLVVDNFEQVASAAPLIGRLIAACPEIAVLVTSRGVLHLAGEQEYPVPPLPVPDATVAPDELAANESVRLFLERARAVRPDFALDATTAAPVAAICARLEGLPLAIELAAARVRLLPPAAILDRLEHSLALLAGGAHDLPGRQQTLRGAVAWSHDLLEPLQRTLFARLSVFAGGSTLEAAEAVVDPAGELGIDVLDGISALVDQSLIRAVDGVDGEPRFRMLHVIREFGLEQLTASGEVTDLRDRHLAYFASLAERAEPELIGSETGRWLDRVEQEHDNIRVALRWAIDSGEIELGMAMAGRLWRFWHQRAHLGEGLAMLRELLASDAAQAPSAGRAKALNGAGGLAYWQNDFPTAKAYYEEHLGLVRQLGDVLGVAEALLNLGYMHAIAGDRPASIAALRESSERFEEAGNERGVAAAMLGLAMGLSLDGRNDAALEAVATAIDHAERARDRYSVASGRGVQGRIMMAIGDTRAALPVVRDALRLFHEAGDISGIAMQLWDVGEVAMRTGRSERALVLGGASGRLREKLAGGAPTALSQSIDVVAEAAKRLSPEASERALETGRALDMEAAIAFALSDDDLPAAGSPPPA